MTTFRPLSHSLPATPTASPLGPSSPPSQPDGTRSLAPYCPTCDAAGFTYRSLPFGDPNFGRAFPCPACGGNPEDNRETLWRLSGITDYERYACTFKAFNTEAAPAMRTAAFACQDWGSGDGPIFLVLTGSRGVGKTHLAVAAAGRCIAREFAVLFATVPDVLRLMRGAVADGSGLPDIERRLTRYPALILDDYGAARRTDFADEQLYVALNERYRQRLRTLVTLNEPPAALEPRVRSRLLDVGISRVVECDGNDYRLTHGSS